MIILYTETEIKLFIKDKTFQYYTMNRTQRNTSVDEKENPLILNDYGVTY